jgi:hypothetical protein
MLGMAESALRLIPVAALAALALAVFRVRSAEVRSAVWTAVLFAGMLMPVTVRMATPLYAPPPGPAMVVRTVAAWSWLDAAGVIYALIAAVLLLRLATGLWIGGRLGMAVAELGDGVRESDRVDVPATFGVLRPFIVLPVSWREWDARKLEAVLRHERAHIARGDFAIQTMASVYAALFWFSPLAWWLRARLAALAEQAADDRALAGFGDRPFYAEVVLGFLGRRRGAGESVAMARGSAAGTRIERILGGCGSPRVLSAGGAIGIAAAVSVALYAASAVSFAQAPPPPPVPPAPPSAPTHRDDSRIQIDDGEIRFRRDGKRYLITDRSLIDQAREFFSPMKALGEQQRAIGEQQRALGEKMRGVSVRPPDLDAEVEKIREAARQLRSRSGATQQEIGELQNLIGHLQHKIGELQHLAGAEQSMLGAEMSKLGAQESALGARQAEAGRKANQQLEQLIDRALKEGKATPESR